MSKLPDSDHVSQFLVLLKMCKGAGVGDTVSKALAEPGLFSYGELLALPNIQQLTGSPHEVYLRTLELFAYGTCLEHSVQPQAYMPLNDQHVRKLKQLTMCTLAAKHKILPYADLITALALESTRSLEDFIIQDCIYPGILKCKLDQVKRCVHVQDVFHRDVRPEQLPALAQGLKQLLDSIHGVMGKLTDNVTQMAAAHSSSVEAEARFQEQLEQSKKSVEMLEALKREDLEGACTEEAMAGLPAAPPRFGLPGHRGHRGGHRGSTMPDAKRRR